MKKHFLIAGIAALMLAACNNKPASELTLSGLDPAKFQTEVNNAQTALYTLKNKAGMEVCITNFGGRIVSIMVPDKNGKMQDVVLGFDSIADYINVPSDFGASIGRYANRINQGRFVLDGDTIQLPQNNFRPLPARRPERMAIPSIRSQPYRSDNTGTDSYLSGR